MNKKRLTALLFAGMMIFSSAVRVLAEKESEAAEFPTLHTNYYMLADLDSGRVLYSKNPDEKIYPASTTKILTGIMVLENCNLSDVVTATAEAIDPIGRNHSNMGILVGEELTVEQLLCGMLVHSANDAANVLGVHMAGSLEGFCDMMNARAKELGAENTHFTNAHGFHDDEHYTTVADLAKITSYAMKNARFAEIVQMSKYQIPATNKYHETRYLSSTNMMLSNNRTQVHLYPYAIGVKTGSTEEAGNCLVAAAEKNGTRLMTVVMKCENDGLTDGAYSVTDSRALLDYGFKNYRHTIVAGLGDVVADSKVAQAKGGIRVTLSPATELNVLLPKDTDSDSIKATIVKNEDISAPIAKGDALGTVTYFLDGEALGTVNLIAGNDVERDVLIYLLSVIGKILPYLLLAFLVVFIPVVMLKRRRSRRRKQRRRNLRNFRD